ncbi:TonB-dependent receptor [Pedobacter sp. Hv1]|uniref:TonB-dependent receptor n=1 Tax=Pedobacter sp. Hv1 TaxID=1740090 RepID=UPI0006D8B772|nr:TonB-dependent receptor [Pedobacter sp. Hv1]KQC00334.1 TonB-dependent receptor [Pedobacter sp. Hv1]
MRIKLLLYLILLAGFAQAQTDTIKKLNEVVVKGYYNPQPLLRAVGSVTVLDSSQAKNHATSSLVTLVNTAPGVRMEERSPGSYRLSLRGSLLRSPFGIRNIKIYMDDFPLTDAGGNTYLNLLDAATLGSIEIYKGPEASIFGASTGGAVLIGSSLGSTNQLKASVGMGSYGLLHQTASLDQVYKNYRFSINQGYQKSNGYRENSALNRKYIQTTQQWAYNQKGQLKAVLWYSNLHYQTPGGLTPDEMAANPRAARPATPTLASAVQQQAGIYNQTFFGGLAHQYHFNAHIKHVVAFFTSFTDFKNPFILNYEKRKEQTIGFRTFIDYSNATRNIKYQIQGGFEGASTTSDIKNYGNNRGTPDALQVSDHLVANQSFAFLRFNVDVNEQLLIELGTSFNLFNYNYQSYFPQVVAKKERHFKNSLMPKLAFSYLLTSNSTLRASASKGYSPPTLAEVRSSDNIINNNLQAEGGWNYEAGLRYASNNRRFDLDATVFYFQLKNAIVRRLNNNSVEYFINAGGTKQLGAEIQSAWWLLKLSPTHFLNGLQWRNSYTYSHFRFDEFKNAQQDYTNNRLTGVPNHTWVSSLELNLKKGFYTFVQHNYTTSIPLNDANTIFTKKYQLIDVRAGLRNITLGKTSLAISFGINNLLNQTYSLGNDLNAANNRYFNPAPGINYDAGISIKL